MAISEHQEAKLGHYQIEGSETIVNALTTAFKQVGIDPGKKQTALADWVNCDCLNEMYRKTDRPLQMYTTVWDHPTLITPEKITIFESSTDK